jgi:hypothetical protein
VGGEGVHAGDLAQGLLEVVDDLEGSLGEGAAEKKLRQQRR